MPTELGVLVDLACETAPRRPGLSVAATRPFGSLAGPREHGELHLRSGESATSTSSMGRRRSGLSEPKRRMASVEGHDGKSPRSTFRMCSQSLRIISSMISRTWGAAAKEVSTSIWVEFRLAVGTQVFVRRSTLTIWQQRSAGHHQQPLEQLGTAAGRRTCPLCTRLGTR